jgi:hypothetical protein
MGAELLPSTVSDWGLLAHESLERVWAEPVPPVLEGLLYGPGSSHTSIASALETIDASDWPLLPNLVPLMAVDEQSFACVVLSDAEGPALPGAGRVVRWHLGVKDERHQAALLDTDCYAYVTSVREELEARDEGLARVLDVVGPAYRSAFIDKEKRPREFIVRPVRIACQNVIVALAAFAQDSAFDGLAAVAWQTCEVPHVATHEANRALAALTLCDAFKAGGTMEIRFDRPARVETGGGSVVLRGHPEKCVPASLRRFARTVGVELGAEDPAAVSPAEARRLFTAVTPMPDALRRRVDEATEKEGVAPERICFALMTGTWTALELDFMLATTDRASSIVAGGAPWQDRQARQAESEVCRAALMAGMLFNRLNNRDSAADASGVRVLEDNRQGVAWQVDPENGAVRFSGLDDSQSLPWGHLGKGSHLTVLPRSAVTAAAVQAAKAALDDGPCALLVPLDCAAELPSDVQVLRCPDRLASLDKAIEGKLLTARISRA